MTVYAVAHFASGMITAKIPKNSEDKQLCGDDPVSIMIVDGHAMFREGLRRLLDSEPGFHVAADTGDGDQVVELVLDLKPHILLFDPKNLRSHINGSGMDVLRTLASKTHDMRTILLTASIDENQLVEVLKLGVRGVVPKKENIIVLIKSIRTVMAGEYWISRDVIPALVRNLTSLAALLEQRNDLMDCPISRRELQVVQAVVSGYSNKEIARELSVSEQAVKYHLTNIFRKFGVSGRMELARLSIERRLIREA